MASKTKTQKSENYASSIPIAKLEDIVLTDFTRGCLHKVAISAGFQTYSLLSDHGSKVGDGFVGNMLKITIKEEKSTKTLEVLVKVPKGNKARRDAMKIMNLFKKEIFVYNECLPKLVSIQKDFKVCNSIWFLNFPKVYHAEFDVKLDDAVIIMEDLRNSDYKMWNKSVPINYEHAKLLMTTLGRLHALSFGMRIKNPEQFQGMQNLVDDFSDILQTPQMEVLLKGSVSRSLDYLKPEETKIRMKIMELIENINDICIENVKATYVEPYAVMLHGDCWINNYLFRYEDTKPKDIKLIDWQITRYGSPAIDLMYFLFICTDQHLRAEHFKDLINIYYYSFKEHLGSLGCDAVELFPFEILQAHLKMFGKFGVIMSTFILPALLAKSEQVIDIDYVMENPDEMNEMAERVVDNMIETDSFIKRVRGVIFDAIDYGYL